MIVDSPEKMLEFGKELAEKYKIILLEGELGAGKTLLTKWFASKLGINKNLVQSPTYAYVNIYGNKILHIDMYRLEKFEDMVEKWILDQINNFEYIVIERPKFIDKLWLSNYTRVKIEKISEEKRKIEIIENAN